MSGFNNKLLHSSFLPQKYDLGVSDNEKRGKRAYVSLAPAFEVLTCFESGHLLDDKTSDNSQIKGDHVP